MSDHYILVGQTAVPVEPCDPYTPEGIAGLVQWGQWFEEEDNRRVMETTVLCMCRVSTVFLGMNHNFREGPPLLFETMAFWRGGGGEETNRCSTWSGAERMHRRMVARVVSPRSVLAYVWRQGAAAWDEAREDWTRRWRELRGLGPERSSDPTLASALDSLGQMQARMKEWAEETDWMIYG